MTPFPSTVAVLQPRTARSKTSVHNSTRSLPSTQAAAPCSRRRASFRQGSSNQPWSGMSRGRGSKSRIGSRIRRFEKPCLASSASSSFALRDVCDPSFADNGLPQRSRSVNRRDVFPAPRGPSMNRTRPLLCWSISLAVGFGRAASSITSLIQASAPRNSCFSNSERCSHGIGRASETRRRGTALNLQDTCWRGKNEASSAARDPARPRGGQRPEIGDGSAGLRYVRPDEKPSRSRSPLRSR